MPRPALLFLIPLFVFSVLGGMWMVMPRLFARFGGWMRLAERYRATRPPIGKKFSWQSLRLNSVSYNNCLTIYVSAEGLYLRASWLLRSGHPDLLIPWPEIHDPKVQRILWTDFVHLQIGRPSIARLRVSERLFKELPPVTI